MPEKRDSLIVTRFIRMPCLPWGEMLALGVLLLLILA